MCAGPGERSNCPCSYLSIGNVLAAIAHVRASRGSMKEFDVHLLRVLVFCGVPCGLEGVALLLAAAKSFAKAFASHSIYSTDTICSAAFLDMMHLP
jgi:hypothetical protein